LATTDTILAENKRAWSGEIESPFFLAAASAEGAIPQTRLAAGAYWKVVLVVLPLVGVLLH
jgi:hypothetical protein